MTCLADLSLEQQFELAKHYVQGRMGRLQYGENRRELSTEDKLAFYSLLMQSTEGKCNTSRPGMMNFVERKKWDAWNALGDMSSEEAKKKYVAKLSEFAPEWFSFSGLDQYRPLP